MIIKKYANRRLYNTARSSYVTLDDLGRMVRAGEDFKVFDAKTGDEITRSVLTQIIFEEEAKGHSMLPTGFLRQIIGLYGDALQTVVPGYLEASMETFNRNQERMRAAFGTDKAIQTFETMARSNMEWFDQAMRMFAPGSQTRGSGPGAVPPKPDPGAQTPQTPQTPEMGEDLTQLREQLREMQSQLEKLTGSRSAVLAETILHQRGQRRHQRLGLRALGGHRDRGPAGGGQHHQPHDRVPGHALALAADARAGVEALDRLDKACRGAGVQPARVADLDLAAEAHAPLRLRVGSRMAAALSM